MKTIALHQRAIAVAGAMLARVHPADLPRPTPCAGWDLGALIGHLTGQNHGFAAAVEAGTAPRSAYEARAEGWPESAERLMRAFALAPADRTVH